MDAKLLVKRPLQASRAYDGEILYVSSTYRTELTLYGGLTTVRADTNSLARGLLGGLAFVDLRFVVCRIADSAQGGCIAGRFIAFSR